MKNTVAPPSIPYSKNNSLNAFSPTPIPPGEIGNKLTTKAIGETISALYKPIIKFKSTDIVHMIKIVNTCPTIPNKTDVSNSLSFINF